jgi:hypothetical protein
MDTHSITSSPSHQVSKATHIVADLLEQTTATVDRVTVGLPVEEAWVTYHVKIGQRVAPAGTPKRSV